MMLVAVTSGSARRRWRRGSVSDSQAPCLTTVNMKNMLCFATHSMDKDMCLYNRPNIVDETIGSTDIRHGTGQWNGLRPSFHLRRRPLAVGAGVEFCYPPSDSFVALNEEATKDSVSSPREALAVTEKPTVLLTPAQTSAQLTVMKHTGVVATYALFFLWQRA